MIYQQFKYQEPSFCNTPNCNNKISWSLEIGKSQFTDFQKLKVQQDPNQIPAGNMPRSMDVIVRGSNVDKVKPGDNCIFHGCLCVTPDIISLLKPGDRQIAVKSLKDKKPPNFIEGVMGLKSLGVKDLSYRLIFLCDAIDVKNNPLNIYQQQKTEQIQFKGEYKFSPENEFQTIFNKLRGSEKVNLNKFLKDGDIYRNIATSIFSQIYGNNQIKKALTLMLFSGIHKQTDQKLSLRGDINILLVGDPATAKSQFLKIVSDLIPRSIYTSGKTTSAAGLTASVTKDELGQYAIQAGALILADNGLCCIDEFDKMDLKDQVAIHQAMQQQTISLSKAGVHATLNARTSILAAANPRFGRYDKSKSLKNNLEISDPIMSRFDLFFILIDEGREQMDKRLAQFMISLHTGKDVNIESEHAYYTKEELKVYLWFAKQINPIFTKQAALRLKQCYKKIRKDRSDSAYKITVRQLQSLIRLSEALARLHHQFYIKIEFVEEAYRLLNDSIFKIEKDPVQLQTGLFTEQQYVRIAKQQMEEITQPKKIITQKISAQRYQQILQNIIKYFRQKQKMLSSQDQPECIYQLLVALKQGEIVNFLLSLEEVEEIEKMEKLEKIFNAVIKRLVDKERILQVVEQHRDVSQRLLTIHANYVQK